MGPLSSLQKKLFQFSGMAVLAACAICTGCGGGASSGGGSRSVGSLAFSSANLSFGNVSVGSKKTLSLQLKNSGTQTAIQVAQLAVSGAAFGASGATAPISLSPGESINVSVTFKPAAGGNAAGSLSIVSDASNPNVSIALTGSGLAAGQLGLAPSVMNFGSVNVGSTKSQTGVLTAGASPLTVSTASWNGAGYSLSGISFPVMLSAGQSVPFTVTFAPSASGSAPGQVSFISDASNSPTNESLSGNGVAASSHSVTLSWNTDTDPVLGYYVYRGNQPGGPYTKVSGLQTTTAYADGAVASSRTYYYVVTALGTNSLESAYSNEAVATIP